MTYGRLLVSLALLAESARGPEAHGCCRSM
jgi:hypothetical protein